MMVIGIIITFVPGTVVALVGWMMVLTGIVGIVGDVMFIQHVDKVIETLTGEEKEKK